MDPKEKFREILREGALRFSAEEVAVSIERPANPEHGDYASNIALQLSKGLRRNPRQIAEEIAKASAPALAATGLFEPLTVAGAGFLNIRVKPFPEGGYRGEYVREIAARLADAHAVRFERASVVLPQAEDPDAALDAQIAYARELLGEDWKLAQDFALEAMLADQREDLAAF